LLPTARRSRCCATKGSARFSRKAAVERLAEKIATAGTQAVLRSRVPFRTIAAQWEASIVPMYKPSTQKNHRHIVHKHLLPRFGGTPIVDMTPQAIQEYIASLIEAGYAPKTIDHIHDVCSRVPYQREMAWYPTRRCPRTPVGDLESAPTADTSVANSRSPRRPSHRCRARSEHRRVLPREGPAGVADESRRSVERWPCWPRCPAPETG